jgi:ADP-ribose pyrophosphatase YjhB (NUDIX family)
VLFRSNNEPFRGYWSFPAGFVDAFEDPLEAARRECLEETGLEVDVTGLLQVIGGREHPNGADIVIVYRATVIGGQLHAGDDADQAEYFSYTSLPPLAFHATRKAIGLE